MNPIATSIMQQQRRPLVLVILVGCLCAATTALDNGLALTPPLAISTWSAFRGNVNHTLLVELADAMVDDLELLDAGYEYLLMDAGWSAPKDPNCHECLPRRNRDGTLRVDFDKFPHGLKPTIDYVHSKGLKFGIWFGQDMCHDANDDQVNDDEDGGSAKTRLRRDSGSKSSDTIDYSELDAKFFASIGVDAVKHDSCLNDTPLSSPEAIQTNFEKYERLSKALNQTGRPILYDVTLQVDKPRTLPAYDYNYIWSSEPYGLERVSSIANMWWSVPLNKYNCWKCCVHPNEFIVENDEDCNNANKPSAWRGLLPMLDIQDMGTVGWKGHWDWGGRDKGWNHLDQLSVCVGESWYGPGLTKTEQVAQISLWAIIASPIIVSTDLRALVKGDFCHSLITNRWLVRVHQDPLGIAGKPIKNDYDADDDDGDIATAQKRNKTITQTKKKSIENNSIVTQLWARPMSKGQVAVIFFNRSEEPQDMEATFREIGIQTTNPYVRTINVWTNQVQHGLTSPIVAKAVEPHGVTFLIVVPERRLSTMLDQ